MPNCLNESDIWKMLKKMLSTANFHTHTLFDIERLNNISENTFLVISCPLSSLAIALLTATRTWNGLTSLNKNNIISY